MNWSWFPRINPVDSRVVSERQGNWRARWLTADVAVWDNGKKLLTSDGRELGPTAALFETGGGKWGAARLVNGMWRVEYDDSTIILDASAPCLSPDGRRRGYIAAPLTNTKRFIIDGALVAQGPLIEPRLSNTAYAYVVQSTGEVYAARYGEPPRKQNVDTGREGWPIPIDTPDGPWLFTGLVHRAGAILRPLDERDGYLRLGENFYPDCVIRNGAWWMVATDRNGRPVEWRGSLSDTRVRLTNPKPPGPPPPPPPEEPPVSMPDVRDRVAARLRFYGLHPSPPLSKDEAIRKNFYSMVAVARELHAEDPRWGILRQDPGRTNVDGFSIDFLTYKVSDTAIVGRDVIEASGGANPKPSWGELYPDVVAKWSSPVGIGDPPPEPPPPEPPPPPSGDWRPRVEALEIALNMLQGEAMALRRDLQVEARARGEAVSAVEGRVAALEGQPPGGVDIEAILREVVARVRTESRGLTFGPHDHALRQVR